MYTVRATYLPRDDMEFDLDYYFREHVRLAKSQTAGKIDFKKIEVETGAEVLQQPGEKRSPCVFVVYLETLEEVEKFRKFFETPDVVPLAEDVPKYTNCDIEWTVAEVHEVG